MGADRPAAHAPTTNPGNLLKTHHTSLNFFLREWLLTASFSGFALTSVYTGRLPAYSLQELQVLFILLTLFIAVKGLERSGLVSRLSQRMERGKAIPLKLVAATFFLSMLVTNDAALVIVVPLTLALQVNRKGILVILEALAANAGSALTPFGNPQNLYIYWFYGLSPLEFVMAILPFSLLFLGLLVLASTAVQTTGHTPRSAIDGNVGKSSRVYGILLVAVILAVLRVLPVSVGLLIILYALLYDRKSLRIDYALLLSFFFFFGLAENLKTLLLAELSHAGHVFLLTAVASQIMSNVPAVLLLAKFTSHWQALLWGASVGGFGSLLGSLANIIAYRLYVTHASTNDSARFTMQFIVIGYAAFAIGVGLYYVLSPVR